MNKKVVKIIGVKNTTYNGRVEMIYKMEVDGFSIADTRDDEISLLRQLKKC